MQEAIQGERGRIERLDSETADRDGRIGDEFARMFSLTRSSEPEQGAKASHAREKQESPDWSKSLSLVQQTAEALRASAERVQKIEERSQAMLQRAAKELQSLHARNESLEARLKACEARENQAEARAREAEGWLRRIHEAIEKELPASLSLLQGISDAASGQTDSA